MKFFTCLLALSMLTVGCGKKKEEEEVGNLKAQFLNKTAAQTELTTSLPSELLVKLKYILVVQDKKNATAETGFNGDNSGNAIRVWVNPKCTSTTVSGDGSSYSDMLTDDQCEANGMGYFDLNRTTAAVNTGMISNRTIVSGFKGMILILKAV